MTHADLARRIAERWDSEARSPKMDWLGFETIIVDVLKSEDSAMTDGDRLSLLREAVDAWTRRGHFLGSY